MRIVIIPEASDTKQGVSVMIKLAQAAGAAVIMSQCLHARKVGEEGEERCPDCGAYNPSTADKCPHGADGQTCEEGCPCSLCHSGAAAPPDACDEHPNGCPPSSEMNVKDGMIIQPPIVKGDPREALDALDPQVI